MDNEHADKLIDVIELLIEAVLDQNELMSADLELAGLEEIDFNKLDS